MIPVYPPSIHNTVVDYVLHDGDVVLDIGGYHGEWTAVLLNKNKDINCRVFVFEPVGRFYDEIKLRFEGRPNITVLNVALSDATGYDTIVEMEEGSHIEDSDYEIETLDVVDFFKKYAIKRVALASVNIEGHEFVLLPRLIESGFIDNIEKLQIQFHETYPNAVERRDKIREWLGVTHEEVYCYPFVWECWKKK
jgi:FkbM family methyltransferase